MAALLAVALSASAFAADPAKVLRIAFPDIASLDPQQISDLYSARVANATFEGLYQYDASQRSTREIRYIVGRLPFRPSNSMATG